MLHRDDINSYGAEMIDEIVSEECPGFVAVYPGDLPYGEIPGEVNSYESWAKGAAELSISKMKCMNCLAEYVPDRDEAFGKFPKTGRAWHICYLGDGSPFCVRCPSCSEMLLSTMPKKCLDGDEWKEGLGDFSEEPDDRILLIMKRDFDVPRLASWKIKNGNKNKKMLYISEATTWIEAHRVPFSEIPLSSFAE